VIVRFLYHPDTVLTAAKLETLALDLLSEIPIPGVEGCGFDSGITRRGKQMAEKLDTTVSYWTEYVTYEGSKRE